MTILTPKRIYGSCLSPVESKAKFKIARYSLELVCCAMAVMLLLYCLSLAAKGLD